MVGRLRELYLARADVSCHVSNVDVIRKALGAEVCAVLDCSDVEIVGLEGFIPMLVVKSVKRDPEVIFRIHLC